MGRRHLWSPDEDEYTLVNREMVEDGHWIYPTANGNPYSIKPPLFNWMGSGLSLLYGEVSELSSRLPSALAGFLGLFVIWWFGKLLFGARAGFLAALVAASTPLYIEFSRWIQINMLSAVLFTSTLALFWWGYTNPRRRTRAYLLMYVPIGLGTLNMGLVNVAMPAIVIGLFLILTRDFRHVLSLKLHFGLLIFLAVAGPWYAVVCRLPEYRDDLLIVTNFGRYFSTSLGHTRPIYYYLGTTPAYFMPWTLFLPSAVLALRTPEGEADRKPLRFVMIWIVSLFVFFSLSSTKRSEYLLPIFPAMALLVGYVIDRGLAKGEHSGTWWKLVAWPMRGTIAIVLVAGIAIGVYGAKTGDGWFATLLPVSAFAVAGAIVAFLLFRRRHGVAAVLAIAAVFAGGAAYASVVAVDRLNDEMSVKSFCANVAHRFPEGERIKLYNYASRAYGYYLRRFSEHSKKREKIDAWVTSPRREFIILREDDYERVKGRLPAETFVVHRQWVDHRYVLLVSNRPD